MCCFPDFLLFYLFQLYYYVHVCVFIMAWFFLSWTILPTPTLSRFPKLAFFGNECYSFAMTLVLAASSPHVFIQLVPFCPFSLGSDVTTSEKSFLTYVLSIPPVLTSHFPHETNHCLKLSY